MTVLASIEALTVRAARGPAAILRGVTLDVPQGAIVGVVGESGSGKSTLGAALMGLLPPGLRATGRIGFGGQDLLTLGPAAFQRLRGRDLAMIAQDPMTALNPLFTVGTHLVDVARRRHPDLSRKQAREAGERCCTASAWPTRRAHGRLSAPALGRHAPAGRDRAWRCWPSRCC